MLTIKAPIELKCTRAMLLSQESFHQRICGNYELMAAYVSQEELLHLVTTPPEIYMGEGGMTSIIHNTRIQNRQEQKIEIINNLLNRIALTENASLTYQDRTYITDVLHKLGIQDARQFMTQVRLLKEETSSMQELIGFYWKHLEELTNAVNQYESHYQTDKVFQQTAYATEKKELHEQIMNRLQTGAIYQVLANFYRSYHDSNFIMEHQELQVIEQKRTAGAILLNQLKQVVGNRNVPFVYRHDNYYENSEFTENEWTEQSVSSRITQAVLLNLADNLYLSRFDRLMQNKGIWMHLENVLYQSAQNTFERIRTEINAHITKDFKEQNTYLYAGEYYHKELETVKQLLAASHEYTELEQQIKRWETEAVSRKELFSWNEALLEHGIDGESLEEAEETKLSAYSKESIQESKTDIQQQTEQMQNLIHEYHKAKQEWQNRFYEAASSYVNKILVQNEYQDTHAMTDIVYRQDMPADGYEAMSQTGQTIEAAVSETNMQRVDEERQTRTQKEASLLEEVSKKQEEMERYYQGNSYQILTQKYENSYQYDRHENSEQIQNRESAAYYEQNLHLKQEENKQESHLNQQENVQLLQELEQINDRNIRNYQLYQKMLQQQQQESHQTQKVYTFQQMREDSLIALEHPEQIIEKYKEKETEHESNRTKRLQEMIELLPQETRKLFDSIEQYRNKQLQAGRLDTQLHNDVGLLLHDIRQIEQSSTVQLENEQESIRTIYEKSGQIINRLEERQQPRVRKHLQDELEYNEIALVHKSEQNQINEEFMEQLLEQNRHSVQKTVVREESVQQFESVEKNRYTQNQKTLLQEKQDINEMIQNGIQRQMGALSEQLYSNLEKRLQKEKKRRGF